MKKLSAILILSILFSSNLFAQAAPAALANDTLPDGSKSDGCSLFFDCNYRQCCVEHDKDYFNGGTGKERLKSDNRLYKCVKRTKGWQNKLIAPLMWMGVRVLGVSFLPTPFRWGFGKTKKKPKSNNEGRIKSNAMRKAN